MKKLLTLLLIIAFTFSGFTQLPNQFVVDEDMVSFGTDFSIENSSGTEIGYIDQEIISLTSNFELKVNGKIIAKAKQRFISIGSKIDIYDGNGKKIGLVEEQIFRSLFSLYSRYIIYDGNGRQIASSIKHSLMVTDFTIKDNSGNVVAEIHRPMVNLFSDTWEVKCYGNFDKRLIIFIPAYKTHRDNSSDD